MANSLSVETKQEAKIIYLKTRSIKQTAKTINISRNTLRRLLRSENLINQLKPQPFRNNQGKNVNLDFRLLEKFFEMGKDNAENLQFVAHVKAVTDAIAEELEVRSPLGLFLLDTAMTEWIVYRRYFIRCFKASDAQYSGPYARHHEKVAKANLRWAEAGQRALNNFLRIIRDLEIKRAKGTDFQTQNIFVGQNAVKFDAR